MKKILIYGVGSLSNRGCEALVNSTISQIDKDVEISLATFDYNNDKDKVSKTVNKVINHYINKEADFDDEMRKKIEYFNSIKFDYNNYESVYQKDVVKEIEDSDLCIHIGGDNYCYGSNEWMYFINDKAHELGKKTILWGASLFDEITDLKLIENLKKYDLLMLREKISYNAVKRFIDEDKLLLVPDPAFSLKPEKVKLNPWYKGRKVLGLNLSPLTIKTDDNYNSIIEFIDYILNKTDYSISLIPHVTLESVSDMIILNRLKDDYFDNDRIFIEKTDYNCSQIKYVISQCDMLIAARTHASIAAYSTFVPTLVIGYSIKSRGIAEELFGNYKNYVLPIEELTYDNLVSYFEYINANREDIKNKLIEQMNFIAKDAACLYSKMKEKLDFLEKKYVCDKAKCSGCGACMNICPNDAIKFEKNSEGFLYPVIDESKCINCGACKKVCPVLNGKSFSEKIVKCYAAKTNDEKLKKKSSSGGIFGNLALNVIRDGGIVYGVTMNNFKVKHIRISAEKELDKILGSKYVQSNVVFIYKSVLEDLNNDKKVLFSGTPCQIMGLKSFLKKEYDNLYCVSVICHGVMNEFVLNKQIKCFEDFYDTKVSDIKFRSKKYGWEKNCIEYYSDRINKTYYSNDDSLMSLYLSDFALRDSCYNCSAKGLNKNGADIILGDYWGVYNVHQDFFDDEGVSCVILKTKKGEKLFNQIGDNISFIETEYEDIVKYNTSFIESVVKPLERNKIFDELRNNNIDVVSDKYRLIKELKIVKENLEKEKNDNYLELQRLSGENTRYYEQLQSIYNSKRFKITDKIFNSINKLLFFKKKSK